MPLKLKLILGSLLNILAFGAADAITGRIDRGLKKFLLMMLIALVATFVEGLISDVLPSLDGWIIWGIARVYLFVALFDGIFTILRANDVAL
ncbi:MAG: hypothetical protein V9H69_23575 [Anaerolineae bacterium]